MEIHELKGVGRLYLNSSNIQPVFSRETINWRGLTRFYVLPVEKLTEKNDETAEETVLDEFPATFYNLYERRSATNIGELINIVLDHIEESNKSKLEGVFRNIDFNSEANLGKTKDRNRRLKTRIEDFHKPQLNMKPSLVSEDVIGNTYI